MKEIRAYIQPFMLPKLTQALLEIQGFPGMSVTDCEGFGRAHVAVSQNYNPFVAKKRVEIFVPDDMAEQVFAAVMKHANTHQHGAGKVYVVDVLEGGRINTGERGPQVA